MKKLFTLITIAFMAMSASAAQLSIGAPTSNLTGDGNVYYDAATKTITFHEEYGYRPGWWLAWNSNTQANTGSDYSDYDEFVLELDGDVNFFVEVVIEYVGDVEDGVANNGGSGNKIVVPLDPTGKATVQQIFLRTDATGVGKSAIFKAAYFQNDEAEKTSINIFEGSPANPLDWGDNMVSATLGDEALALAEAGNYLGIDYTCEPYEADETSRYYQVQFMGVWWTLLEGVIGTNGAEKVSNGSSSNIIVNLEPTSTNLEFKLIDSDVATLKQQKGILLAGHGIYINRVYLRKESQNTAVNTITAAQKVQTGQMYNLAGQRVNDSYKGVVIMNGKKFVK